MSGDRVRMKLQHCRRLPGRHVLLPLLCGLLSLPGVWPLESTIHLPGSSDGCPDVEHNVTRAIGEQWLLPNCGGVATCSGGVSGAIYINVDSCPRNANCRTLEDGDPYAAFPACCPRVACPGCYSEALDRHFPPGVWWTEGHCLRRRCRFGPSGVIESWTEGCKPLGPPPSLDCVVVEQDMARGEHPNCCAHYRCPGLCRDGEEWRPQEGVRGDSCSAPLPETSGVAPRRGAPPPPPLMKTSASAARNGHTPGCLPGVWGC